MPDLDPEAQRLLASYAAGPRIWDAAAVYPVVLRLEAAGLIADTGDGGRYALTEAGARALAD